MFSGCRHQLGLFQRAVKIGFFVFFFFKKPALKNQPRLFLFPFFSEGLGEMGREDFTMKECAPLGVESCFP